MDHSAMSDYMAHGFCLLWQPKLVWLHVISDILTGIAYFSIPVAMAYFIYKRRDLPYPYLFIIFAFFIFACGGTHFFSAYTIYVPMYWQEGYLKAFTALISIIAVVLFIPMIPKALLLPSLPKALEDINQLNKKLAYQLELLRSSEDKYRRFYNDTPVLLHSIDRDGQLVEVNDFWLKTIGYERNEVIGRKVTDFFTDESRKNAEKVTLPAFFQSGLVKDIPYQFVKKNGDLVDVLLSATAERDAAGNVVSSQAVIENITDRERAEKRLRVSEEMYRSLFNNSEVGMFRTRLDGSEILDMNQKFLNIFGRTREEMQGATSVIHWADPEEREDMVRRLEADGRVSEFECKMLDKQGDVKICLTSLRLYREQGILEGSIIDITARKQAEKALLVAEMKYRKLLEDIQLVAIMLDLDGNITFCNNYLLNLTGWSRSEVLNQNWFELFLPADRRKEVYSVFKSISQESTRFSHYENNILTREGVLKLIVWDNSLLRDIEGNVVGLASIGTDVTEHRKLEERLRQAQKMESIGQLSGGIAHDFNNILAAIVGYGNLMQMKMRTDDPSREYLSEILTSAERAAGLTQSLLAFSRKQVISPKNIDLNESIRKIEKLLVRIIGEDIALSTTMSGTELVIFLDPAQIEQILMNLATNARDAMPKGGKILIETGRVMLDDEYIRMHGFGLPGFYAALTVSDTGDGMNDQTKKKIFEPFFTTKEVGKGTGLGLAIVYGIVKQNNGFIDVSTEIGKGTTFTIYFPCVDLCAEEKQHSEAQQPLQEGSETILLAEDNEAVRRLNRQVLQEFGYTIIAAADGEEALQKFRDHWDGISLLILDVIMPKKNGREVFKEARRINPNVEVIFTSGYPADLIQKEGVLEKELHFLSKPSSPQALLRKIREVLDRDNKASS